MCGDADDRGWCTYHVGNDSAVVSQVDPALDRLGTDWELRRKRAIDRLRGKMSHWRFARGIRWHRERESQIGISRSAEGGEELPCDDPTSQDCG
jgi:hypothetical protein